MLELKLLGTPQILLDGCVVSALSAAKSQALLFYLAVNDRPQSRLAMAALLWPDKREPDALTNLRQAVHHLRNGVPAYLLINRLTLALNPALPCWIDAVQVEAALAQTNPLVDRQRALDQYTGAFLASLAVEEAQPFDEWAVVRRERLHHLATTTLHEVVIHLAKGQELAPGLRYTNQWLALEPWREEAHRYQMQFLTWHGQGQAALEHYEQYRHRLREELNAAPAVETVALYEQIRAGKLEPKTGRQEDKTRFTDPLFLSSCLPVFGSAHQDWGEAPTPTPFYGRVAERTLLARWLGEEPCRLVAILGMGGLGKTALAVQVAHAMAPHFDVVIWRSLLNAPPLMEILPGWLQILSQHQLAPALATLDAQLARLFDYLRERRCLLILDNCESILQSDVRAGLYRPGYEDYGQLVRRMGASQHQSTLLLTSREQPHGVELLQRETALVQVLRLVGLEADSGGALLQARGLTSVTGEAARLISRYSGNPLALQIVAQVVADLFDSDLTTFLAQEGLIFDDIRDVLDQQWARLTPLEQAILLWLAIEREIVDMATLRGALVGGSGAPTLLDALRSLQRRSLIELRGAAFTLQNVVIEYLTDRLIDTVVEEVVGGDWQRFHSHALIQAQAKEYVRESQIRMILAPLAERLVARLGRDGLAQRLQAGLAAQRQATPCHPGYAGGNALNLLVHLGYDLQGYDFSHLCVWQADLSMVRLPELNFTQANLAGSRFAGAFHAQQALAWSADGALLASAGSTGEIQLWRTSDHQLIGTCRGHKGAVYALAFSPDSQRLASGSVDRTVCLWDMGNWQLLAQLRGHRRTVQALAWSHDGHQLFSGCLKGTIRIWQLPDGEVAVLRGHTGSIRGLALSPDGATLASASDDQTVRLWDLAIVLRTTQGTGATPRTLAHDTKLAAIAWSHDDALLASGGFGQTIMIWNATTGQLLHKLPIATYVVKCLAFSPHDTRLAASSMTTVQIWEVSTWRPCPALDGRSHEITAISWRPDGRQLAGVAWAVIRIWDVPTGQVVSTLRSHSDEVLSVTFSADGARAASSHVDDMIRIWDTVTWRVCAMMLGHKGWTRDVRFSPDGATLISAGVDQTVRLWDSQSGREQRVLRGHNNWIASMTTSPDGNLIATGSHDRTVWLWDLQQGQARFMLHNHTELIQGLAFSPDSQLLATGSGDTTICLWDTHSGQMLRTLQGHTAEIHTVVFDSTGNFLASGSADETIGVWDVHTGQRLRTLSGHTAIVCELAMSPDGAMLASCGASDQTVRLWDFGSGEPLQVLQHDAWVVTIAFSPDGQTLLSGCEDGQLRLWDVQSGQCRRLFRAPGPYAGTNITGVTGISEAQKVALQALGAVETVR